MRVLGHMALVALVIGTSVVAASTERVTASLVLTSAVAWSFVPIMQFGTGLWLLRGGPPEQRTQALEAYFRTHRAWSLFILAFHAVILAWPSSRGFALMFVPAAALPIVLTARALTTVCRDRLGVSARAARRRVAVHQLVTYLVMATYAAWASAYLPRLVGLLR